MDHTTSVLDLWHRYGLDHDRLLWYVEDGCVIFTADCSDFFDWGSADEERITQENFPVLKKAVEDCKALGLTDWGPRLFCARFRAMRPQGACYKHIPEQLHCLFDACGPVRELSIFNPRNR